MNALRVIAGRYMELLAALRADETWHRYPLSSSGQPAIVPPGPTGLSHLAEMMRRR